MKNSVIAIQPFVITTIIVYALLVPIFFEMENAFGEREYFVDDIDNEKMISYSQQVEVMETECKSPCPSSAEMCIAMCA
ncbi:MAG TPA: hypothetical protein VHJ38_09945 [Nitrososphaeraceae archaeon]|nr:hypothetical protein [Nitrososphaeraceae archaeon]